MKKGKKMPSIELDGHSDAQFVLVDGKIVRAAAPAVPSGPPHASAHSFERIRGE